MAIKVAANADEFAIVVQVVCKFTLRTTLKTVDKSGIFFKCLELTKYHKNISVPSQICLHLQPQLLKYGYLFPQK